VADKVLRMKMPASGGDGVGVSQMTVHRVWSLVGIKRHPLKRSASFPVRTSILPEVCCVLCRRENADAGARSKGIRVWTICWAGGASRFRVSPRRQCVFTAAT